MEEVKLEHSGNINGGEWKPKAVFATEEETEIHQHRDQTDKQKEETVSTFDQVTQIAIDNRPRVQTLRKCLK